MQNYKKSNRTFSKALITVRENQVKSVEESNFKQFFIIKGLLSRNSDAFDSFFLTFCDALIEEVSTWPNYEHLVEKLRKFKPNLIEKGRKAFDPNLNQFNSLIHGDPWTNNIMLKYDEKSNLENAILVDLQLCCWTSSLLDIHYLFNTSLEDNLMLNDQNELVEFYHEQLASILRQLNYQKHIPSLDELRSQFLATNIYGSCEILSLISLSK